jgi:hypothetical protein
MSLLNEPDAREKKSKERLASASINRFDDFFFAIACEHRECSQKYERTNLTQFRRFGGE